MQPTQLKSEDFIAYPPEARKLAVANLRMLQQLPLSFAPSLLREIIDYDFKFPAERASIVAEFATLSALPPTQVNDWFQPFAQLTLSPKLQEFDWVNQPAQFVEQQSAHLWSTHQLDAFRKAATDYGHRLQSSQATSPLPTRRLGIAVIGQGVASYDAPLFRNLRRHGTFFDQVKPEKTPGEGLAQLLAGVAARAKTHSEPYAHWYVDGGQEADHSPSLTCVSYKRLEPVRAALLRNMDVEIAKPGMGPEELRSHMARLLPSDLGMNAADVVLDRFQVRLLTEGSGTQIFSTTFAQWTTREALRRAQPLTLLVRYAPRQRQKPMNEMLSNAGPATDLDPTGSLVDGDMAAYYHWINQQRLSGAEDSSFLAWFEGHNQALAIGPSLPRGTASTQSIGLADLLALVAG